MFRVQVASFAELDSLTKENHETLEETKRLVSKPAASSCPRGTEPTDTDKLLQLNRLAAMAKALGEVAMSTAKRNSLHRSENEIGLTAEPKAILHR